MKWLFDTVGRVWHLWAQDEPTDTDQSLCTAHVADDTLTDGGDDSQMPTKCSACVTAGRGMGLPI